VLRCDKEVLLAVATPIGRLFVSVFLDDKEYKAGLNNAAAATERTGARMKALGDSLDKWVTRGFLAAGAALAAFAGASLKVGATFEDQMARVAAISGATGEEIAQLTEKARQLGRDTLFTATQAGEALQQFAQAGFSVRDSLMAIDAALIFAGASGASIADAADLTIATLKQFGLAATESGRVTDVLSKAIRTSLFDFSSLKEAMKFAGVAGSSFGMSLEETVAAVAQFRNLGLEGSLAGTAFKMAMTQAGTASEAAAGKLRKYGLTLDDINPDTHKFAEILDTIGKAGVKGTDAMVVFGARSGAAMGVLGELAAQGKIDLEAYTQTLLDSGGQTAEMYATILDTVKSQSLITLSSFQELLIQVFLGFGGKAKEVFGALTDVFNVLTADIKARSAEMARDFGGAFDLLTMYIRTEGPALGRMFIDAAMAVGRLVVALGPVIRNLDLIAGFAAAAFVAARVTAYAESLAVLGLRLVAVATSAKTAGLALSTMNPVMAALQIAVMATAAAFLVLEKNAAKAEARAAAMSESSTAIPALKATIASEIVPELTKVTAQLDAIDRELASGVDEQAGALTRWGQSLQSMDAAAAEKHREVLARTRGELQADADALEARRKNIETQIGQYMERAKAEKEADDERNARQKEAAAVLEDARQELEKLNGEIEAGVVATGDFADGLADVADAARDFMEGGGAVGGWLQDWLEADGAAVFGSQVDAATDSLASLSDAVDSIAPPDVLSRGDQLRLLLLDLGEASARTGVDVSEMSARLRKAIEDDAIAATEEMGQAFEDVTPAINAALRAIAWQSVVDALGPLGDMGSAVVKVWRQVGGSISSAVSKVAGALDTLSGGSLGALLSPQGIIQAAGDLRSQAKADIVDNAVDAARAAAEAAGQAFDEDAFRASFRPDPKELDKTARKMARAYVDGLIRDGMMFVRSLADNLPVMINRIVAGIPRLISAIVKKVPDIVGALAKAAPVIAVGIIEEIPAIVVALFRALWAGVTGLVNGIGEGIAKLIADGVVDAIKAAFHAVMRFFRDLIREIGSFGTKETETFGDTPGAVVAGAQGMLARFAPRDIVIADQTAEGALRQAMGLLNQRSAGQAQAPRQPVAQGLGSVSVPVLIDGAVVAAAMVNASRTGRAPELKQALRRGVGARTGFDRGDFSMHRR